MKTIKTMDILHKGYNNCYKGFNFLINSLEYKEVAFNNELTTANSAYGKLQFT